MIEKLLLTACGALMAASLMGAISGLSAIAARKSIEPVQAVLEAQIELNEQLAARPDICGLIEVVCEGEHTPTIEERIEQAARAYGVSPVAALAIAGCESSFNPYATNSNSSAKGLYQFTDGTWDYIQASGHQFDVRENIRQFMIWYPVHPEWWECE